MHLPLVALLAAASVAEGNHVEVAFGYLGQYADERNRALELKPSATDPASAGAVTDPFLGAPFAGTVLAGPMVEWRGIHQHVRLTLGFRWPFANFRPSDTAQVVDLGGQSREVIVRSMSLWDFRTGIGFEVPFKHLTPFLDVLGDVQHLTTQLSIDGATAKYTGRAFSLGARVGLKYQVDHLFVALAAEATAVGPLRYGGSLMVGMGF